MIIWHGFEYGYSAKDDEWYVINRKTSETQWFIDYESALAYVETHRA